MRAYAWGVAGAVALVAGEAALVRSAKGALLAGPLVIAVALYALSAVAMRQVIVETATYAAAVVVFGVVFDVGCVLLIAAQREALRVGDWGGLALVMIGGIVQTLWGAEASP